MNDLVECPNCGEINIEGSVYCQECGNQLNIADNISSSKKSSRKALEIQKRKKDTAMGTDWIIIAVVFPIIGIFGGLFYGAKGRKGAWTIIFISILAWIIWFFILTMI